MLDKNPPDAVRTFAVATVTAALMVSLVACSAGAVEELALPAKNASLWVMPMDSYLPSPEADESSYYAGILVDASCLTKAGYPTAVPFRDPSRSWRSDTVNASGRRIFTIETATRFGYHDAPADLPNRDEWSRFLHSDLSAKASNALDTCRDHPSETVPNVERIHNALADHAMAADERAQQSTEVKAAAAAWRECMAPLGVADLPDAPWDMPAPSQAAQFGLEGDEGRNTDQASSAEIAAAVHDATCRESTGFSTAYYDAAWDEEVSLLRENLPAFERGRAEWKKALEVTTRLIAEYGR